MAQYIPKEPLVKEIEKRIQEYKDAQTYSLYSYYDGLIFALEDLKNDFLDTIEVKEIGFDLGDPKGDKSAKFIIDTKSLEVKEVDLNDHQIADIIQNLFPIDQFIESETLLLNREEALKFARHFFELGIKMRKEE